jgi:hypothetical protein
VFGFRENPQRSFDKKKLVWPNSAQNQEGKMAEIQIDRKALKAIVTSLRPGGENEWCVACGAGAASSKLDLPDPELLKQTGQQFLDIKSLKDFVAGMRDAKEDWCVACGAGAAASPLSRALPADISDAEIDALANRLIGAVKVG